MIAFRKGLFLVELMRDTYGWATSIFLPDYSSSSTSTGYAHTPGRWTLVKMELVPYGVMNGNMVESDESQAIAHAQAWIKEACGEE